MTKDEIIRMAREAGLPMAWISDTGVLNWTDLEAFANLVLANNPPQSSMAWQEGYEAGKQAEREDCAKVCEGRLQEGLNFEGCAAAIRARGTT